MRDHEPNEYGFAGDPTTPEVRPDLAEQDPAEEVAIPDDDLTAAIGEGLADATDEDDFETTRPDADADRDADDGR
jgi:hypothetical protein